MATTQETKLNTVLKELKDIKAQLRKLLLLIPEDSLNDYENSKEIEASLRNALRTHAPR